ncbi:nucleotide pyrophosphohydrolase [Paenibacillus radicis (ex Xue et al. 2023)]|uniref:Nucleotide pyrophosphohydrolase n=1 Tax=Paenibacillus radicis (ex Xue et al. 2023) TaxID=2972489 RepID=A0ABT1YV49_9BACL|nr:nucleotide pyrophosphohydrolase [Paenibacillus radicis (ex Xue et al. 2023)]MCR8636825.1 nucleotide pyrophosphohydrolase [Paenibacillus radicis (ex Xue et al. 2023)]
MDSIIKKIIEFRDERDWKQFHNPKDLAISLTLEASELLENFQWKDSSEAIKQNMEQIKDELADVLIYSLMIAHDLEIDIESAILSKIEKNAKKYPIDRFKGTSKKYSEERE